MEEKYNPLVMIHKKEMEKRASVLNYALIMENFTSMFLKELFGVTKSADKTYCFGNKSSSLPFNTKIHLLMDVGVVDEKTKTKFQHFMSIRNQFMHNIDARSYTECIKNIDGLEKYLEKNYKIEKTDDREQDLRDAVEALSKDCLSNTSSVIAHIKKQREREKYRKFDYAFYKEATKQIKKKEVDYFERLKQLIKNNPTISAKEAKELYFSTFGNLFTEIILEVEEQLKIGIETRP